MPQIDVIDEYILDHFVSVSCHLKTLFIAAIELCKSTAPSLPLSQTPGDEGKGIGLFLASYAINSLTLIMASS